MLRRVRRALRTALVAGSLMGAIGTDAIARQDAPAFDPAAFDIGLDEIASGFDSPVYVTGPDDGSGRLFVVEQTGRIRIIVGGETLEQPFLDITGMVESGSSEQGLLSVAFPQDFA